MYFCKKTNETGEVEALITYNNKPVLKNPLTVEITEEEYNTLQAELAAQWEEENPTEENTEEIATEADYIAALQEVGVEV